MLSISSIKSDIVLKLVIVVFSPLLFLSIIIYFHKTNNKEIYLKSIYSKERTKKLLKYLFISWSAFIPYLTIMSLLFSNIIIRTDKDYYYENETIIVSLIPSGYVFLPTIIKAGYKNEAKDFNILPSRIPVTKKINIKKLTSMSSNGDYIYVKYTTAFRITNKSFRRIHVAR